VAVYTFQPIPVWGSVGRTVRLGGAKGATYQITDPSGAPVTVNETGKTYVTADANGMLPQFHTTDVPTVVVQVSPGLSITVHSIEAIAGSASYAAAAANSATAAGDARDEAVAALASKANQTDLDAVKAQQDALAGSAVTVSELVQSGIITSYSSGATPASQEANGASHSLWIAPFDCTITWMALSFEYFNLAMDNTNYWAFYLQRYRAGVFDTISYKDTRIGSEAIVRRTPWQYTGASYNITNAAMKENDILMLTTVKTGAPAAIQWPMQYTFRYQPI
jgi:hypothetical protein